MANVAGDAGRQRFQRSASPKGKCQLRNVRPAIPFARTAVEMRPPSFSLNSGLLQGARRCAIFVDANIGHGNRRTTITGHVMLDPLDLFHDSFYRVNATSVTVSRAYVLNWPGLNFPRASARKGRRSSANNAVACATNSISPTLCSAGLPTVCVTDLRVFAGYSPTSQAAVR